MPDTPTLIGRAMRLFSRRDEKESEPLLEGKEISPLVVFCFVVNSCIGVGFLSLPRAFDRAGLLWASALCVIVGFVSLAGAAWVVVAMSNTEALLRYFSLVEKEDHAGAEAVRARPDFTITSRKNELSQIIGLLFGPGPKRVYIAVFSYLMYTCLWCFASVFASSMAAKIPLPFLGSPNSFTCDLYQDQGWNCRLLYLQHIILFACVCVPFSVVQLKETTWFQIGMAILRFVLIGLILADSMRMYFSGEAPPNFYKYDPEHYPEKSGMMDFQHTREILSILVFAMMVQIMIPSTSQMLANKEKTMLPTVMSALLFCIVVYLAVGLSVAMVFGSATLPVASLNWRNYTGGLEAAPRWAGYFSDMLIIFPTLDIMSAYPLIAYCLGENLMLLAPAGFADKKYAVCWRLLAALPPFVGALLVDNVTVLFEYGALGAWMLMVFFPAACLYQSQKLCDERFGRDCRKRNPFRTWLSSDWVLYCVVGVSAVLYGYHCISLAMHKLG